MTGEAKPLGLENAAGDREEDGTTGYRWYLSGAFLGTLAILGIIGMFYVALSLFVLGPTAALMQQKDAVLPASPISWFPGWFGVFNAWLLIVVTAIPYAVTFSYVLTMRAEKTNRLHLQLKNLEPDDRRAVETILDSMFRFSRYVGAAAAPTVVTFLGATAILFFKPVMTAEIAGIDLSQGANVLLLGIGIADVAAPDKTGPILFWSITAFSFGFLGAWLYFVTDLTRSFFNCDLRPRTLIAGAIRMSVASVVALVAALALQSVMGLELAASVSEMAAAATDGLVGGTKTPGTAGNWLVALAFTIGFFPQTGFGYIKSVGSMVLRILPGNAYNTTALTELPGMSYGHSERLQLEGIDAVENLAGQHPILMTLQTGFTYAIVEAWIGEAWLRGYLGETRHAALAEKTGLRGKYELRRLAWRLAATQDGPPSQGDAAQALETFLIEAMDPQKADIQRWQVLARLCLYFDSWGGSTGQ